MLFQGDYRMLELISRHTPEQEFVELLRARDGDASLQSEQIRERIAILYV